MTLDPFDQFGNAPPSPLPPPILDEDNAMAEPADQVPPAEPSAPTVSEAPSAAPVAPTPPVADPVVGPEKAQAKKPAAAPQVETPPAVKEPAEPAKPSSEAPPAAAETPAAPSAPPVEQSSAGPAAPTSQPTPLPKAQPVETRPVPLGGDGTIASSPRHQTLQDVVNGAKPPCTIVCRNYSILREVEELIADKPGEYRTRVNEKQEPPALWRRL